MPATITEYLFLVAVVLPPVVLAIGFLYMISPHSQDRADNRIH
jgi:ABC-type spermidine/putrescine transport system permease subunit II